MLTNNRKIGLVTRISANNDHIFQIPISQLDIKESEESIEEE
jgi:hypothetical protein